MNNNSIVKYKTNIFTRIKNAIRFIFVKKRNDVCDNLENRVVGVDIEEKERILELYTKIKQDESIITGISEQDLYKIMLLLNEEITIVNDKLEIKAKELEDRVKRINQETV